MVWDDIGHHSGCKNSGQVPGTPAKKHKTTQHNSKHLENLETAHKKTKPTEPIKNTRKQTQQLPKQLQTTEKYKSVRKKIETPEMKHKQLIFHKTSENI